MTELSPQEAFELLGVPLGSSDEDIVAAHRELAKSCHSDKGGSDEEMCRVNEARAVALRFRAASLAVVLEPNDSGTQLTHVQKRELADRNVERETNRIISMRVNRLAHKRNQLVGMGGISAIASLVFTQLPFSFITSWPLVLDGFWWIPLIVATPFAFQTLLLQNQIQSIKGTADALNHAFSDLNDCAEFLGAMFKGVNHDNSFMRNDIEQMITEVIEGSTMHRDDKGARMLKECLGMSFLEFRSALEVLGSYEITKIFLIRAVEHGLLIERIQGTQITYNLSSQMV